MEKVPTKGRERELTGGPETVLTIAMEEVLTLPMENLLDIHRIADSYTASMSSGLCRRVLSKRSKNSCIASAGTRSPMDSCGR